MKSWIPMKKLNFLTRGKLKKHISKNKKMKRARIIIFVTIAIRIPIYH